MNAHTFERCELPVMKKFLFLTSLYDWTAATTSYSFLNVLQPFMFRILDVKFALGVHARVAHLNVIF
jgi:hypothetical protein